MTAHLQLNIYYYYIIITI